MFIRKDHEIILNTEEWVTLTIELKVTYEKLGRLEYICTDESYEYLEVDGDPVSVEWLLSHIEMDELLELIAITEDQGEEHKEDDY